MSAIDTMNLLIDEKAVSYAKIYSSLLKDEFQRKRAYASLVALYALLSEVEKTDNDVQKSMTLFRNPVLNEEYEISDFYINNWHVDVRVVTDGTAFLVPKAHYDNDLQPDFYAVVKVDKTLSSAQLLGFAATADVKKEGFDYHYYSISLNSLISYDDFLTKINNTKVTAFSEEEHEFFKSNYLSLLDEEIEVTTKNRLIKHIFECSKCRTEFCCFTGFEMVSCNMGKYPNLLEDQTLNIVGAQSVDDDKYAGKEEIIKITDDEEEVLSDESEQEETIEEEITEETTEEENREETVSDILDELFNMEEDFIEQEPIKEKPVMTAPIQVSESGDLEIIEENIEQEASVADMPVLETYGAENIQTSSDLEIIEDEIIDEQNPNNDEVVLLENEPIVLTEEELALPEDTATVISDEIETPEENVQKVIVDYDEYGEPIYSYITNVGQEEELDESTEIEPLPEDDDDILNEEFETYPQQDDVIGSLNDINSGMARPVEYVTNEEIATDEVTEFEEYKEEDQAENSEVEYEEYKEESVVQDDDEALDISLEDEQTTDVQAQDEAVEYEQYEETQEDDFLEQDDEVQQVDEEEQSEEYDDVQEYDDENQEYEEYQDEDGMEGDEEEGYGIPEENLAKPSSKKSLMIIAMLVIFALVGCGAGAFFFLKKPQQTSAPTQPTENSVEMPVEAPVDNPVDNSQVNDMFETVEGEDMGLEVPSAPAEVAQNSELPPPPPVEASQPSPVENPPVAPLTEADLVQNQTPEQVSNSIANAFSPSTNVVTLRNVNWLCAPQLFADTEFKIYLQKLDNILKLNLRKNILDISESPQNNSVTVKMAVDNMGNLLRVAMSESSGSQQVDNIVLQSINETFEGEKSQILNESAQKADKYYLKVVIKL